MNFSPLLSVSATFCLFFLSGCGDRDKGGIADSRALDRSSLIREQYKDREAAVEASMQGRLSYQVKPQVSGLDTMTETQLQSQRDMLRMLLRGADEAPLNAAMALQTVNASPILGEGLDLEAARAILKAQLQTVRASLDKLPGGKALSVQSINDLAQLVVLSVALDREEYALDYERGIVGLLDVLDSTGRFGELRGGLMRSFQVNSALTQAAYAAALGGDDRLRSHSYFAFAPYWFMHHFQPNGDPYITHQISPEEARAVKRMTYGALMGMAALYPSPEIQWWMNNFGQEKSGAGFDMVDQYLGEGELPADFAPPPYGLYPFAGVLFWRSSWAKDADSLLARGAVEDDPGSWRDAGHVSWIAHGDPVLIQAQDSLQCAPISPDVTAKPAVILMRTIPAHNVIRVGDAEPKAGRAPIITRELDASGGNLRIDASSLYPELSQWHRDVFWEAGGEMRVIDTIGYALGQRERTTIFWHLNTTEPVQLQTDRSRTIVEWGDSAIVIQGNSPLEIEQFLVPDAVGASTSHIVLALRTIARPPSLRILTRVLPREKTKAVEPRADSTVAPTEK